MPRRGDLESVLVIGSGPIVIGQGCEFDYSGTQAAKVLHEYGYRVVLVNSNPATIMTDPKFADATYIEPITAEIVAAIIAKELPDALLPTLGGQTALNVTTELATSGVLEEYGVELIGAGIDAIAKAEDRGRFRDTMAAAGIAIPRSETAKSVTDAMAAAERIGFPVMIRPSYILGGGGTGVAESVDGLVGAVRVGLAASPVQEVLVEESLVGWKEFELEVMRDGAGNAVVVCSIENLDPMGVHTGDSITVAPIQTLSDREYQLMRNDAIRCLEEIGVATGGSNVQFAVDPASGRRLIIEMNPRVSRSSALASKATGFPIAKIAALTAIGMRLDEIQNDITGATPACFEPALDYVVVKVPRFDFPKFPSASGRLGTSMQSVGEAMAIGRTFPEALQKAIRSLETRRAGLIADEAQDDLIAQPDEDLSRLVSQPSDVRIFAVAEAVRRGWSADSIHELSGIDPWFVHQIEEIVSRASELDGGGWTDDQLRNAKRLGFSDLQLAHLSDSSESAVRDARKAASIVPTYKIVDTCAAEFEAQTPYFYSSYEDEDELMTSSAERVIVLGSGPNRIGQGIEFDYCCVHAAFALEEAGYETVMVNCNPETVSTDYDTSDRLYFEPLTVEDVLSIIDKEQPAAVLVQLGGQTPLNLASRLAANGVPIAGTSPEAIERAEDREQFSVLCRELGIRQPAHGTAWTQEEAEQVSERIGLPILARPSFVLGGRAMRVIYHHDQLLEHLQGLFESIQTALPILIDRFLEAATEVDIDAVFDGHELLVGGIMEHVQEAGVHSGDSAVVVPPPTLSEESQEEMIAITEALARSLEVRGLINLQFAVQGGEVYMLEANPRASRTVPFISKATGIPLAKIAARVMMGDSISNLRAAGAIPDVRSQDFVAVKEAVHPWDRFPMEDVVLGPEMKATGEVMGIGDDVGTAYSKALLGAGHSIPRSGTVFISLADREKARGLAVAQSFKSLGFRMLATKGTARYLAHHGVSTDVLDKIGEGPRDAATLIDAGEIDLVLNIPSGRRARSDGGRIRRAARNRLVPCVTTVQAGLAVARSLRSESDLVTEVKSLQDWHA